MASFRKFIGASGSATPKSTAPPGMKQFPGFNAVVVSGASARHEFDDHFLAVAADHFGVCKPKSKVDSAFLWLINFVLGLNTSEHTITSGKEKREEEASLQ